MKCPSCNSLVEPHYKFCEKCGNDFSVNKPIEDNFFNGDHNQTSSHQLQNDFYSLLKKNPLLSSIVAFGLFIIVLFGFFTFRFNQLIDDISFVTTWNVDEIEDSFVGLPNLYSNVGTIRSEYDFVLRQYSIMDRTFNPDYRAMREAYFELSEFSNGSNRWGLDPLLKAYGDRPLYGRWSTSCFGGFSTRTTTFALEPGENGALLSTNMVNAKSNIKSYYYTYNSDWTTIGYKNQNDSNDKFDSFKILSVNRNQLRVRNLYDNLVYTFNHCGY